MNLTEFYDALGAKAAATNGFHTLRATLLDMFTVQPGEYSERVANAWHTSNGTVGEGVAALPTMIPVTTIAEANAESNARRNDAQATSLTVLFKDFRSCPLFVSEEELQDDFL